MDRIKMEQQSYIFVHLMGGLGNQLFQYAAGLLQKKVTNGMLLLEKANNNTHDNDKDYRPILFTQAIPYDAMIPNHVSLYQDDGFKAWNPEEYKFPTLYMFGYFQNYPSLKPILPEFKTLILERLQDRKIKMKEKYIIPSNSGFIHVRRGDYLQHGFYMTNIDTYYEIAVNTIIKDKNIEYWYILSDDLDYIKKEPFLQTLNPIYVDEKDPLDCLAFMSEIHDAAIIANSTFSWMGAYLGLGTNQSVIYPKNWINKSEPDLFPEEWVGI